MPTPTTNGALRPQQLPRNRQSPKRGKRIRLQHAGTMRPDELYTREALKVDFGITEEQLDAAKATGIVHAKYIGREVFFHGQELIEWIRKHGSTVSPMRKSTTFKPLSNTG